MLELRTATLVAGAAGLAFLGYCVYFDRKRRSDPLYKEKLRARREKERKKDGSGGRPLPDLSDPAAIQSYFMQEIQTGEEKLSLGLIDEGLDHLTNALAICGQPQQLLSVLQQTLPAPIFQQLIMRLPSIQARQQAARPAEPTNPIITEVEDDMD